MAIEVIDAIGIQRTLHDSGTLDVDAQAILYSKDITNSDATRNTYFSGSETVLFDTTRVIRTIPNYRCITNENQPFTYPDGRPIEHAKITFTLCDSSGHAIQATDPVTGDTVVGTVTVYTDEYGEFSVYLWPNSRSKEDTYYMFHIDFYGMDDGMIYIPENPDTLLFSTTWSYHDALPNPKFLSKDKNELPFNVEVKSSTGTEISMEFSVSQPASNEV